MPAPPATPRLRVAVIGSGIAGLTVAARLAPDHDLTVFEADDWVGGHTHTVDVEEDGRTIAVDTGFIVSNDWTYPEFLKLMGKLGVRLQDSNMSFSLQDERTGLEYNGTTVNALFAQRRNLLRPSFLGMVADILRFFRSAPAYLARRDATTTLGEYLAAGRYGRPFVEQFIVPMGRAIWSADGPGMLNFPATMFIDFFKRHGFLNVNNRPVWKVVQGGSREYVRRLAAPFADRIRTRTPVAGLRRHADGVDIHTQAGETLRFDAVFIAAHADQALRLLEDPSAAEREVLSAFPYQPNDAVLHTDERLLPKRALARAAWNYHLRTDDHRVAGCPVTYDMNILQSLRTRRRYLVSLNMTDRIDPATVLGRWSYDHPVYTPRGVAAQARHAELGGVRRTFYCGAYWRYGFHEDGVVSGLAALDQFAAWQAARADGPRDTTGGRDGERTLLRVG